MNVLSDQQIARLADWVRLKYGLDFTPERWNDLRRVVTGFVNEVAPEESAAVYLERCLDDGFTANDQEILIDRLTIGETYLFREPNTLKVIEREILKPLAGKGSGRNGAIRIWSAACASGEEPYTFALIGDQLGIDVEVVGTDLDSRALEKARKAVYRKWSFRNEMAFAVRERYFSRIDENAFRLDEDIASRVRFMNLNLVDGVFPAYIDSFDLILCRNVLMYFSRDSVAVALKRMKRALSDNGWFVSTASESCLVIEHGGFRCRNVEGTLLFTGNKDLMIDQACSATDVKCDYPSVSNLVLEFHGNSSDTCQNVFSEKSADYFNPEKDSADYPENLDKPDVAFNKTNLNEDFLFAEKFSELENIPEPLSDIVDMLEKGRTFFNSGECEQARNMCNEVLKVNHVTPEAYFLLGEISLKDNDTVEAIKSFRKALYADPSLTMADVMLGNIYLNNGNWRSASVHFRSALRNLCGRDKDDLIEYSGDLTAGRLAEMIEKLSSVCIDRHERNRYQP